MTRTTAASRPLRLLVLADGGSIHTERWLKGLAASGPIELHLTTMNPAGVRSGIRDIEAVRRIDELYAAPVRPEGGNWRYLFNLPGVLRAARRARPDAIVAIYLSSYGVMGAIAKGRAVLAHVLIGSDIMVAPGAARHHAWLARWALRRGDVFVSSSQAMTARLAAITPIPTGALLTQQYGLEDWILDHPSAVKTYGFVSNRAWVANSQIPLLLRVFRSVPSAGTLALIGEGGSLDREIREEARRDPRIALLGALSHQQNVDVVSRASFYLSMTASDGASLSLMEAMALGAIPAVSDIEPNREWVEDGVTGVLLPVDDVSAAAGRIDWLMGQPDSVLDEMRRRNRALVRERGSLTRNMARFRGLLSDAVARRGEA